MDYYRAFPFYMGYNGMPGRDGVYQGYGQWNIVQGAQQPVPMPMPVPVPEDRILEDLEYLQQMYPTYAKKYQSVIGSAVDKMDYKGSFIYDQYPDKLTLQRMVDGVMAVIKSNEQPQEDARENAAQERDVDARTLTENAPWEEKEPWIRELVTVLVYYEILARRRKSQGRSVYLNGGLR